MVFVTFQVVFCWNSPLHSEGFLTPIVVYCIVLSLLPIYLPSHALTNSLINFRKSKNFLKTLLILSSFHLMTLLFFFSFKALCNDRSDCTNKLSLQQPAFSQILWNHWNTIPQNNIAVNLWLWNLPGENLIVPEWNNRRSLCDRSVFFSWQSLAADKQDTGARFLWRCDMKLLGCSCK